MNVCRPVMALPTLPLKPSAKPQVIKKDKKAQVIYNESRANYMVSKHIFGHLVSTERDPASRRCIVISSSKGALRV